MNFIQKYFFMCTLSVARLEAILLLNSDFVSREWIELEYRWQAHVVNTVEQKRMQMIVNGMSKKRCCWVE